MPCAGETDEIAKACPRVCVRTAVGRHPAPERGEQQRKRQGADCGEPEGDQTDRSVWRERGRKVEHPDADNRAKYERNGLRNAKTRHRWLCTGFDVGTR
jgi:hypothetical protein